MSGDGGSGLGLRYNMTDFMTIFNIVLWTINVVSVIALSVYFIWRYFNNRRVEREVGIHNWMIKMGLYETLGIILFKHGKYKRKILRVIR